MQLILVATTALLAVSAVVAAPSGYSSDKHQYKQEHFAPCKQHHKQTWWDKNGKEYGWEHNKACLVQKKSWGHDDKSYSGHYEKDYQKPKSYYGHLAYDSTDYGYQAKCDKKYQDKTYSECNESYSYAKTNYCGKSGSTKYGDCITKLSQVFDKCIKSIDSHKPYCWDAKYLPEGKSYDDSYKKDDHKKDDYKKDDYKKDDYKKDDYKKDDYKKDDYKKDDYKKDDYKKDDYKKDEYKPAETYKQDEYKKDDKKYISYAPTEYNDDKYDSGYDQSYDDNSYDNSYDDSYDNTYDDSYDNTYDDSYDNTYDDSYDTTYDDSYADDYKTEEYKPKQYLSFDSSSHDDSCSAATSHFKSTGSRTLKQCASIACAPGQTAAYRKRAIQQCYALEKAARGNNHGKIPHGW